MENTKKIITIINKKIKKIIIYFGMILSTLNLIIQYMLLLLVIVQEVSIRITALNYEFSVDAFFLVLTIVLIKKIKKNENTMITILYIAINSTIACVVYKIVIVASRLVLYGEEKIIVFNNIHISKSWTTNIKLYQLDKHLEKNQEILQLFPNTIEYLKKNIEHCTLEYAYRCIYVLKNEAGIINTNENISVAVDTISASDIPITLVIGVVLILIGMYIYTSKND